MGVEHYLVCKKCKQFIDLHKCYAFSAILSRETPPSGAAHKYDPTGAGGDYFLRGGYWESRGVWFLWKHREHKGVELLNDCADDTYDEIEKLEEVFSHEDDLKLRGKQGGPAGVEPAAK